MVRKTKKKKKKNVSWLETCVVELQELEGVFSGSIQATSDDRRSKPFQCTSAKYSLSPGCKFKAQWTLMCSRENSATAFANCIERIRATRIPSIVRRPRHLCSRLNRVVEVYNSSTIRPGMAGVSKASTERKAKELPFSLSLCLSLSQCSSPCWKWPFLFSGCLSGASEGLFLLKNPHCKQRYNESHSAHYF